MVFYDNIIDRIIENNYNNLYVFATLNFNDCALSHYPIETIDFIIKYYEEYFNKTYLKDKQIPMCNTFIIPVNYYQEIMNWVVDSYDKLYPWACEPPNYSGVGAIGGIYERVMGFALSQINSNLIYINVCHEHEYKKYVY
jgi:hypothetical protein